ncbi:MAG: response regulator, partial [Oscillospiraceae bacterium]
DDDAIRRLYEPFEQADSTISQKYGGTGLGMSITKNLVTLMSGFIDVKSKVDCGTRCTVDIPLEKGEAELIKEQHSLLEPLNVLVVDDEEDVCEHTVLLLEKINMRAKKALSGQEAIELVKKAQLDKDEFDICFIDWLMPNMSGIETTRQIRACIGPDKPIIIISAYDWADIEDEARKAGVNAFISKPLFISSLYNTLVNVTNGNIAKTNYVKVEHENLIGGKNILVAEDNELNLEIAQALLQMNGAVVTAATNGKEALDIFSNSAPNYFSAILMDVQMPVMGGYDATKNIRALTRTDAQTIPIIATTANAFSEDVSAALACGMNAHISKPIDANKLCEMLAKFINN